MRHRPIVEVAGDHSEQDDTLFVRGQVMNTLLGMMVIGWAPWLLLGGSGVYLGLRYVRALEGRNASRTEFAQLRERVLLLEDSLSSVAVDLEKVVEGQQFTSQLLAERSASSGTRVT